MPFKELSTPRQTTFSPEDSTKTPCLVGFFFCTDVAAGTVKLGCIADTADGGQKHRITVDSKTGSALVDAFRATATSALQAIKIPTDYQNGLMQAAEVENYQNALSGNMQSLQSQESSLQIGGLDFCKVYNDYLDKATWDECKTFIGGQESNTAFILSTIGGLKQRTIRKPLAVS